MSRGLALGALLGGIIACAASNKAAVAPAAPTSADAGPVMPGNPHAEISALEKHIVDQGGTFVAQDVMASAAVPMTVAPKSSDATCHPAQTDRCSDSCKLSDSICDDAKKICDIATTLAGDTWAAGKCESGKTSCTDAHAHCCSCR